MATLKPKLTIFEIRHKKCKTTTAADDTANAANTMRAMRELNSGKIEMFQKKRTRNIESMTEVIKRVKSDAYIPYRPQNDDMEKHLEVNSFQKEAADAMLEMSGKKQQGPKGQRVKNLK